MISSWAGVRQINNHNSQKPLGTKVHQFKISRTFSHVQAALAQHAVLQVGTRKSRFMVAFLGSFSEKLSITKCQKNTEIWRLHFAHWGQGGFGGDRVWKYRANLLDANGKTQRQYLCKYFPDPFSDLSEGWFQRCCLEE